MNTIIVVDARERKLENVFAASATTLPDNSNAIVLRKGTKVGTMEQLAGRNLDYPILVVGSYQARSSAGHVTPLGAENHNSVVWIGGAGFGFTSQTEEGKNVHKGFGLRPFAFPLTGTLLPAGTRLEKVETHRNSNPGTAEAAFAGLKLQAELNTRLFILAEGQSDYTSAYSFEVPEGAEHPEFPQEHRTDIFSSEKMFNAAVRRLVKGDEGRKALTFAIMRAGYRAGKDASFIGGLPAAVCEILGDEEIERIVEEQVAAYEAEGWKFGYDMSLANHFTRAISPDGKTTDGSALFNFGGVEEEFLALATLNSDEEKRDMRTSNLAARLESYFWYGWACSSHQFGFSDSNCDYLVEAAFVNGTPAARLWFAHSERLGPNGEPNNGYRFLSAFDARGYHLWPNLLEMTQLVIAAYNREGEKVAERIWKSDEDPGCGGASRPWMAS